MKFSCEKQNLVSAVSIASRAAAAKSAVLSLEGLLIEADEGVTVTGYDLKTGIRSFIPSDVTEPGAFVINAKIFGEIIRKLPDDVVNIAVSDNYTVEIKCGMSEFTIMGMNAGDYPDLPTVDYQNTIELLEKDLKALISETNFAVSDNEARPIHTGALFELENGTVTVVAVDGYRLALRREKVTLAEIDNASFVVPGSALSEVEKITSDTEDIAKITVGTKHIMFNIGKNLKRDDRGHQGIGDRHVSADEERHRRKQEQSFEGAKDDPLDLTVRDKQPLHCQIAVPVVVDRFFQRLIALAGQVKRFDHAHPLKAFKHLGYQGRLISLPYRR